MGAAALYSTTAWIASGAPAEPPFQLTTLMQCGKGASKGLDASGRGPQRKLSSQAVVRCTASVKEGATKIISW